MNRLPCTRTTDGQRCVLLTPALLGAVIVGACSATDEAPSVPLPIEEEPAAEDPQFIALFDGESLDGWTPKFSGHELGVNVKNTFRVEDGLLKVRYDEYESFDRLFGHLFFDGEYSSYDLRVIYRFVGEQCPGGAGWAFRNNGVMFHGQSAASMGLAQDFPVSIEAQMLGTTDPDQNRPNGGICTPGTKVAINGMVVNDHCIPSSGPSSFGDEWVELRLEVRGSDSVKHFVNGELVHEYSEPQLAPNEADAAPLIAAGAPLLLDRGTISIQAESHPIDFKTIELRVLLAD